jgi:hypothetical protein
MVCTNRRAVLVKISDGAIPYQGVPSKQVDRVLLSALRYLNS